MLKKVETLYDDGKKSLEILLREKAYEEVKSELESQNIDIEDVNDEDIETLVAAKTKDMTNSLKGFGWGSAFALALTSFLGV